MGLDARLVPRIGDNSCHNPNIILHSLDAKILFQANLWSQQVSEADLPNDF
jgi:hypothetical protein